jgi:hypothetical protein
MTDGRHFRDEPTTAFYPPPADPWANDAYTTRKPADALAARRARPHCVYWLPGWQGEVVRVGITSDLDARMARYERDAANPRTRVSRWWHLVAQPLAPRVEWFPNWHAARSVEIAENGRLCPPGNYQDVPAHRRARLHDAPARPRRPRRPVPWKVWLCLLVWALATAACAVVLHFGEASDQMIWLVSLSFGTGAAWPLTMDLLKRARKLGIR